MTHASKTHAPVKQSSRSSSEKPGRRPIRELSLDDLAAVTGDGGDGGDGVIELGDGGYYGYADFGGIAGGADGAGGGGGGDGGGEL